MAVERASASFLPPQATALIKAVSDALTQGNPALAAKRCRPLIQRFPRLADAHFMVGLAATELGDTPMAVRALKTALSLNRDFTPAWAQLARVFALVGAFDDARIALDKALALKPQAPALLDMVGSVYALLGLTEQSCDYHQRAVAAAAKTGRVPAAQRLNLARAASFMGRTEQARMLFDGLADDPLHGAEALWSKARLKGTAAEIPRIEAALTRPDVAPLQRAYLWHALGTLHEQQQHYEAAWQAFDQMAAAKKSVTPYDEARDLGGLERLMGAFDADWWARHQPQPEADSPQGGPLFILGLPRTGSTLLEHMIGAHKEVEALGELQQWPLAVRQAEKATPALANIAPPALGRQYLQTVAYRRAGAPFFTDKLPTNFRYCALIAAALPSARLIHIRRHPLDTCFAIYKHLFADAYPWSYDLTTLARFYCAYDRLMAQYRALLGERLIEVWYEALVTNPAGEMTALLKRLGIPPAVLHYQGASAPVTTASAAQVRDAPHRRSVGRWQLYRDQLMPLKRLLERKKIPLD